MINCIIIDDEEIARLGLEKYIHQVPFLKCIGSYASAKDALERLSSPGVALLFLDIQLPGMNGMDLLRTLSAPPLTIITSAFPEYALEGFSLDVIDYLVKPFSFERFLKAATKANDFMELRDKAHEKGRYFFIKANNRIEKVEMDNILFVQALENYVHIYTQTQRYLTLVSLKAIEELLSGKGFLRVQKSYVVSVGKVDGVEGDHLLLAGHRIPIGKKFRDEVLQKVLQNKYLRRG